MTPSPPNNAPGGGPRRRQVPHFGGLAGLSIRRPVFTAMVMIGLVVVGLFSFRQLPIDQFPDIEIPVVVVQTVYPGASPEVVEREVTRRLEEAFNPVEAVDDITSVSLEGVSQIIIQFELERSVDQAMDDVRAKIETVRRELPLEIENPVVLKFDPSAQPIVSLALSSSRLSIAELTPLADETLRRQLEAVSGVGEVQVAGGLEREIHVNLLPERLQSLGVSVGQVMGALQAQNLEVPAGRLERGNREELVRVTGRITEPAQFADVVVDVRGGQPVRLGDVARVEDATEEERSLAFVGSDRAVGLDILKVSGANTVAVAEAVIARVAEIQEALPEGTRLQVIRDNSVIIRNSVRDVIFELLLGAILTVVVVMLFLNDYKATVITSLALPISVISAFLLMNALGFTLNVITLMALSLSIGILIDDAIIVIENIVRHRQMGKGAFEASGVGTQEIFLAVLATTFSIVAVFVPVAFMGGIIGRFFFQFGLTVAFAVLVSLFVSFTLTPMLSAWWGVEPQGSGSGGNVLTRAIGRFNRWFDRQALRYRGVIEWALGHRKSVIALATASFIGALMLFPYIGGAFMPPSDESQFAVTFEVPEGSSLAYTRSKALQIAEALGELDEVAYTYTTVGAGATGTVTAGEVYVRLVPPSERSRSQLAMMPVARERLRAVFGADIAVLDVGGFGGARAPLQVEVRGPDIRELQAIALRVQEEVERIPGIVDVQNSVGEPRPEYRIELNRALASEMGLSVGAVAQTVRPVMAGQEVTTWEDPSGEERDVVVRVAPEYRASVEDLAAIPLVAMPMGGRAAPTVSLGQVARIERGEAPAQIDRKNLQRVVTISGSTEPGFSVGEASAAITARLAGMELPPGYAVGLAGETEMLEETAGYVLEALLLAVILIFLILASQFESVLHPMAIMLSLPLSLIGVLLALLMTGDTLNMMSMIGVILLMGLVTKNAILLVDNANERRAAGADRWSAVVEAGQVRLRPILMTTLAMIAGMTPIALALGEGGAFRAPLARAVIGGLLTSTLLTLIVIPVAYTYFDDFGAWLRRTFGAREEPAAEEAAPAEAERVEA